jgi:hypothetical protein
MLSYTYAHCHLCCVVYKCLCAECRYTDCRYAEYRYTECCYAERHYAERHYAECRYAERRGATYTSFLYLLVFRRFRRKDFFRQIFCFANFLFRRKF